jgi:hypothetical protein
MIHVERTSAEKCVNSPGYGVSLGEGENDSTRFLTYLVAAYSSS